MGTTLVLVGMLTLALAGPASASAAHVPQIVVRPGHSIQQAINEAAPGTTIVVRKGTYHENLQINKDGIHLQGNDVILTPPSTPRHTRCDAFPEAAPGSGICFAGVFNPTTLVVSAPIHNVGLEGFTVVGFSGNGVLAVGVQGFTVERDVFARNGGYGIFSSHSSHVAYGDSVSHANGDAGFYIGESPDADAVVHNNASFDNRAEGILFRDSTEASTTHNRLTDNCAGLIAVDTGAPGSDGYASIEDNWVSHNNLICPPSGDAPPLSGIGIALVGATHVTVDENLVNGNQPTGASFVSGGIVVVSGAAIGGAVESHDRIADNDLAGNKPADILWDRSGVAITFADNDCGTSVPAGLCMS